MVLENDHDCRHRETGANMQVNQDLHVIDRETLPRTWATYGTAKCPAS